MSLPFLLDAPYIRQRFDLGLPGLVAHQEMAVPNRWIPQTPPENAKIAAVLILIYPDPTGKQHIVFIERPGGERGVHSGQISFPGGRYESSDADLQATALREANEEVGINPRQIEVLGALTPLYIPVSNFHVHPFVGFTEQEPLFHPQASEVESILQIPFSHFFKDDVRQITSIKVGSGMLLKEVPYFNINQQVIWGATSMILNEFIRLLK